MDGERLGDADAVRRHDLLVMIGPERRRGRARIVELVVGGIAEPDRERLYRSRRMLRHQRENGGRVDAAAQERAERDVGSQPDANGLAQLGAELLNRLAFRQCVAFGGLRPLPERFEPRRRVRGVDDERRAGRHAPHALEDGALAGYVAEGEKAEQRVGAHRGRTTDGIEDGFRFGREDQLAVLPQVIQRLLAGAIAREHEAPPRRIPDGDREHPAHAAEAIDAFGGVQVRDHFGVARGREAASGAPQLVAQLDVVVDLAVLHHRDGAAVDRDRLMPAGDVDDAQPRGRECRRWIDKCAAIVGAAVAQRGDHPLETVAVGRTAVERYESSNPTHFLIRVGPHPDALTPSRRRARAYLEQNVATEPHPRSLSLGGPASPGFPPAPVCSWGSTAFRNARGAPPPPASLAPSPPPEPHALRWRPRA